MSEKKVKVKFWRVFWPSLVAGIVVSGLGILMWLIVIGAFIGGLDDGNKLKVEDKTVLHMTLDGPIAERASSDFNPMSFQLNRTLGLSEILYGLEHAKNDKKIKGVYLEIDMIQCGYATAKEIRDAINDFEESGKFVVAYNSGEAISQKEYYIASAANENYGFPTSNMEFLGLGAELMYFKKTLDKLDVEMQVIRGSNNDFKSAVEPFFRENMSDSSRLQTERYLDGMWKLIRSEIAKDRGVSAQKLNDIAEEASIKSVKDAIKYKLIDEAKYRDEVLDIIASKVGASSGEDVELLSFAKYSNKRYYQDQKLQQADDPNVAVILAEGEITRNGNGLTSEDICGLIRDARNNESVKTIVLRVNSPGGSALASDEIWREVQKTNQTKKVIVSMGDVAASGGYYISAPASYIFAEPNTITGSIGVFGVIPYTGAMLENNLGLTFDRVATNKHSVLTTNRKLTEEEFNMIQESVDDIYDDFKGVVAKGRGMTKEQVDVIARGRVWTGEDAKNIGLIDELGGLQDAIDYAAEQAGVKDKKVVYYPFAKEDKFAEFIEALEEQEQTSIKTSTPELPASLIKHYEQLKTLESYQGIQMRMPYIVNID